MDDIDHLVPIADRVTDQCSRSGLASLAPHDQVFFLVWCHAGELGMGGHVGFFSSSKADNYSETVEALTLLGLDLSCNLLHRAAAILFTGVVPRDTAARNGIIDPLLEDAAIDKQLESLDQQFFTNGGSDREVEVLGRWYSKQLSV